MGISRPGPDAAEVSARTDGPWVGERRPEAPVEVAADSAEQRGLFQRRWAAPEKSMSELGDVFSCSFLVLCRMLRCSG